MNPFFMRPVSATVVGGGICNCRVRGVAGGAVALAAWLTLMSLAAGCTQETQNQLGRSIQNWTGTNGVLDVLAGDKLYMRFIEIDKLSTALATFGTREKARPYRFGYGVHDRNLNYKADPGEKKVYFEVSDYSTSYVFYENDVD
jgi:hypothetical protein